MSPTSNPDTLFELMDRLTENSVAITQVTGELSNLNMRLVETNNGLKAFTEEIRKTLKDHEDRIVDVEHNCRRTQDWNRAWSRIECLEQDKQQRVGSAYWIEKMIESAKYLILLVIGAFIMFLLKGGTI